MPIEFRCEHCHKRLRVGDAAEGKKARCPDCGNIQDVPSSETQPEPGPIREKPAPQAAPPNPFSDTAATGPAWSSRGSNPYQSPAADGAYARTFGAQGLASRHAVAARVQGPATGLMALATLNLALIGFATVAQIALVAAVGEPDPSLAINIFSAIVGVAIAVTILVGAARMKKLENYSLAVAASVLAAIPCFGCCILGVPLGIWSLVVLSDPAVRASFQ